MGQSDPRPAGLEPVRATYSPEDNRTLSDAVLEALDAHLDEDILRTDFTLYENINTDALNNLFKENPTSETKVAFTVEDRLITLWGDGEIEIRVTKNPLAPI